jgi:hypothetical protein
MRRGNRGPDPGARQGTPHPQGMSRRNQAEPPLSNRPVGGSLWKDQQEDNKDKGDIGPVKSEKQIKYRVFISYSPENKGLVEEVAAILSENKELDILLDDDVTHNHMFSEEIKKLIAQVDIFMPVITERSSIRGWVHQEIGYATALNVPVLPLVAAQVPREMVQHMKFVLWDDDSQILKERLNKHISNTISNVARPLEIYPVKSEKQIKYRIFISASSADYSYAKEVYKVLLQNGVQSFLSEESLPVLGSSDYRKEIDKALDNAEHMIVVASSVENTRSPWVKAE